MMERRKGATDEQVRAEIIKSYKDEIRKTKEFDRYIRGSFIFKNPELVINTANAHKKLIGELETTIRDLQNR